MSTHSAVAITAKGVVDAIQVPTKKPGSGEILLKVEYASLMAFDVFQADVNFFVQSYPVILGFNAAGTIAEVGPDVKDFSVGERITSYALSSRATQEYTILSANECSKIPANLTLESAATVPDNFVTGFYVVFDQLKLPIPKELPAREAPPNADIPILVYGSGSTSGQYTVQLLKLAGYTRIIATASPKHHAGLRSLGAAHVIDYNSPTLIDDIAKAAGGKVKLALDCISAEGTTAIVSKVIDPEGTVCLLLPIKRGNAATSSELYTQLPEDNNPFPKSLNIIYVSTFMYQKNDYMREKLFSKVLPSLLANGTIKPNEVLLLDEGSLKDRVVKGLGLLRDNKLGGEKLIVKIAA